MMQGSPRVDEPDIERKSNDKVLTEKMHDLSEGY